jgi:phenylalanyl-tRNA synthetase beta chain
LEKISFPVTYTVAEPSQVSFIPLNCDFKMTLAEILKNHPKGQEYGFILEGTHRYPLLIDQKQQVLSFPPIINSRDLGEVKAGDQNLLVEVTGTDLRMVALTINIWAANLSDRGASIESVEVVYPEKTVFGKKVRMPFSFSKPLCVSLTDIDKAFAERFQTKEVMGLLKGFGHLVKLKGKKLEVTAPPYRDDLMHPVDVIEEVAISRGYDQFKPELPPHFTVGDLSKEEKCSDWVRTFLIGMGFQEMNSNILCSREEIVERMQLDGGGVVEVDNIMSETYAVLRDSLLPSLLKVEAASSKAFYPHQIFEVGEVVRKTHPEDDPVTQVNLGALVAHPGANFSETHTYLEMLFYYMNCVYDLEPISHPSFLEGRVGRIRIEGKGVGFLGEIHPEVLDRWGILTPCSAFEVSLGEFF